MQFLGEAWEASFQDSNAFAFMKLKDFTFTGNIWQPFQRETAARLIIQAVVYLVGQGISKD